MPTFTISVDRTSLSATALVLSGTEGVGGLLGVTAYVEPALQPQVRYAPSSSLMHGEIALGWSWQQTLLTFEVAAFGAATEQQQRDAVAELVAAVTQFPRFLVTVTVDDAAPETWTCDPATVSPVDDRTYANLADHNPTWRVTIPCHPVRTVA